MLRARRLRMMLAIGWLSCQVVGLAAPLTADSLVSAEEQCTCPGGTPGAICPMHHKMFGAPAPADSQGPALRNSCAAPSALLLSLAGGLGVLPMPATTDQAETTTAVVPGIDRLILHADVPDAPPPRA